MPQPAQQVPDGVAVQQLLLPGIAAFGEGACDPAFEAGQVFITGRQGTGGDQDGAQVLDRFAGWELVERGMAECPLAGTEFAQELAMAVLFSHCQHEVGPFAAGQVVVQATQFGPDAAAVIGSKAC